MEKKAVQKSIRVSQRTADYIQNYRGDNFSDKIECMAYDMSQRHEQMVLDWERLNAQCVDLRAEAARLRERIMKLRTLGARFDPFFAALIDLIGKE